MIVHFLNSFLGGSGGCRNPLHLLTINTPLMIGVQLLINYISRYETKKSLSNEMNPNYNLCNDSN